MTATVLSLRVAGGGETPETGWSRHRGSSRTGTARRGTYVVDRAGNVKRERLASDGVLVADSKHTLGLEVGGGLEVALGLVEADQAAAV